MNFPLIANVVVFAVLLFALGQTRVARRIYLHCYVKNIALNQLMKMHNAK